MDGQDTKLTIPESQKETDELNEYLGNELDQTKKQLLAAMQVIEDLKSQLANVQALLCNPGHAKSFQTDDNTPQITVVDLSKKVVVLSELDRRNIICYSSSDSDSNSEIEIESDSDSSVTDNNSESNIKGNSTKKYYDNNFNINNNDINNSSNNGNSNINSNGNCNSNSNGNSNSNSNSNNNSNSNSNSNNSSNKNSNSKENTANTIDKFLISRCMRTHSGSIKRKERGINSCNLKDSSCGSIAKFVGSYVNDLSDSSVLLVLDRMLEDRNFVDGSGIVSDMLKNNLDKILVSCFEKDNKAIRIKALKILNNMIAATRLHQHKTIMNRNKKLLQKLMKLVNNECVEIQQYALLVLNNIMSFLTSQSSYKWKNDSGSIKHIILFSEAILSSVSFKSTQIWINVCSILHNLSIDEQNEVLGAMLDRKTIVDSLIFCLSQSIDLKTPAIGVLANLAAFKSTKPFPLLKCGLMEGIVKLLNEKESTDIVSTICRLVSKLTSGNEVNIQAVIDHELLPTMVSFMYTSPTKCRLSAACAVVQALSGGNQDQIAYLIKIDAIEAICKILATDFLQGEPHLLLEIFKNLHYLFEKFDHVSYFEHISSVVDKYNGWQAIQNSSQYFKDKLKQSSVPDGTREVYTEICACGDSLTKQNIIVYGTRQRSSQQAVKANNGSSSHSTIVTPRNASTKRKAVEIIDVVESNKKLCPLKVCSSRCGIVAKLGRELLTASPSDNEAVEKLIKLGFAKGSQQMEFMLSKKMDVTIVSILESSTSEVSVCFETLLYFIGIQELLVNSLKLLNKWIVNTTSYQFQLMMCRNNFVHMLSNLISDSSNEIQEHAFWVLDNMVLDGAVTKRKVLDAQVLPITLEKLRKSKSMEVILKCVKLLCSLSSYLFFQWAEDSADITSIVECITEVLSSSTDSQVLIHCNNALFNLTSDEQEPILMKMSETADLTTSIVDCFTLKQVALTSAALHTIANMTALDSKENYEAFPLVRYGILDALSKNWSIFDTNCVTQAYRAIANISRGNEHDVQAIIDSGLMSRMIHMMKTSNAYRYIYACYSMVNVLHGASLSQVQYLVEHGMVQIVCKFLDSKFSKYPDFALESLLGLKALFEKFNYLSDFEYVSELVDSVQGWSKIVKCANHFRNSLKYGKMTEDKFELLAKLCNTADSITKQNMMDYYRQMELERNGAEISDGILDWHIFGKEEDLEKEFEVDFMVQDDLSGSSDEDII